MNWRTFNRTAVFIATFTASTVGFYYIVNLPVTLSEELKLSSMAGLLLMLAMEIFRDGGKKK